MGVYVTSSILRVLLSGLWVSGSQVSSSRVPVPGSWVSGSRFPGSQSHRFRGPRVTGPRSQGPRSWASVSPVSGSQDPGSHGPGSQVLILDSTVWQDPKYIFVCSINIYFFNVNNRNTRRRCEICSKLTIWTPVRRQWRLFGAIVNFEHILHLLLFLLLTLNKKISTVWGGII